MATKEKPKVKVPCTDCGKDLEGKVQYYPKEGSKRLCEDCNLKDA